MKFLLTCEHGGNLIPSKYRLPFIGKETDLRSHRGYDPGALDIFNTLKPLSDFHYSHMISRLLIELNRSLHHPNLFSEYCRGLEVREKNEIIVEHYNPYRDSVEKEIVNSLKGGEQILHLSVHSFTPELKEIVRNADIGLLYDPGRSGEKDFCRNLKEKIQTENGQLKIRFNYPYLGKADGFTTYLRKIFPKNYIGIELEVNQKFVLNNKTDDRLKRVLFEAIRSSL